MIKRKRDEEEKGIETGDEELTAFKKCNIINRSPLKKEKEEGEGTVLILGEIRKLGEEGRRDKVKVLDKLEGIRSEIEGIKKEIKWKEEKWEKEREELKRRIEDLERCSKRIDEEEKEKMRKLEKKVECLEERRERNKKTDEGEDVGKEKEKYNNQKDKGGRRVEGENYGYMETSRSEGRGGRDEECEVRR